MQLKAFKQGVALTCVLLFSASASFAQTSTPPAPPAQPKAEAPLPAAQTLIDRHIEAVGGRGVIKSINSVAAKGSLSIPANGITGTIEIFSARPNKTLVKTTLAGVGESIEGFDGSVAWSNSPMTGPMIASGKELAERAFYSDFDSALGVAARYESIKTVERTTFEGRPVYKVVLTKKTGGDDVEFYDAETGLKAGALMERTTPMGTIPVTVTVSDYKKFGNLLQPTVVKQSLMGTSIVTTFTTVEYNKVDPAVFELPAEIKALVK